MQASRCYHQGKDTPHLQAFLVGVVEDPMGTISILACRSPSVQMEVGMNYWSGEIRGGRRTDRSLAVPIDL